MSSALVLFDVSCWPLWARRTFVLTLPISGPLWVSSVALVAALVIALGAIGMCAMIILLGLAWAVQPLFSLAEVAGDLWSRP